MLLKSRNWLRASQSFRHEHAWIRLKPSSDLFETFQVLDMANEAVRGWEQNTVVSRLSALQAANRSASDAQECNKITRRMNPVTAINTPGAYVNELSSNQTFDPSVLGVRSPGTPPRAENGQRNNNLAYETPSPQAEPMAYE